jgi:hypothetical protein
MPINAKFRHQYVQLLEMVCKETANSFSAKHMMASPFIGMALLIPDQMLADKIGERESQLDVIDQIISHAGLTTVDVKLLAPRIAVLRGLATTFVMSAAPAIAAAAPAVPAAPVIPAAPAAIPTPAANHENVFLLFPTAEMLTRFVDALLSRDGIATLPAAQLRRDMRIWINPGTPGSKFGVLLQLERGPLSREFQDLLKLCDGEKCTAFPSGGESMDLNKYLERVRLYNTGALPTRLECLILLNEGGVSDELVKAFREFPAGQSSQCRFFLGEKDDRGKPVTMLIFEHVRGIARVAQWVRQLPASMSVFCPVDGGARDVLFCPWQFSHPVAALSRLYDCGDARFILMRPRGSAPVPRAWLRISRQAADEAVRSLDKLFHIEIDPEKYVAPVVVDPLRTRKGGGIAPSDDERILLPLVVNRSGAGGIINAGTRQRHAEALRRQLAEIEARHERAQQLALGHSRVALVFHQDKGEQIPPRLRRFLQRPYQTLDSYSYFFLRGARGRQHVLFSNDPTPLTDHLVSCADEMFVQDARWPAWGLKAYLRHGVELSPRLDDQAMAQLVSKYLMPTDKEQPEACLVDAITAEDGSINLSIVAIGKGQLLELTKAIRLLNEQLTEGVEVAARDFPEKARASLEVRKMELEGTAQDTIPGGPAPQGLAQFYEEMAGDLRICTTEATLRWRALDGRIQTVIVQLDETEPQVREIEELLKSPAVPWEAFVTRVLETNIRLCAGKKGCFEALTQTEMAAQQNFDDAMATNVNAQTRIDAAQAHIGTLIDALAPIENDTRAKLDSLDARMNALNSGVAAMKGRLDPVIVTIDRNAESVAREGETLTERLAEAQQKLDKCLAEQAVIASKRHKLAALQGETTALLAGQQADLRRLAAEEAEWKRRNSELAEVRKRVTDQARVVERLRRAAGSDEFSQAVQQWLMAFERRPTGWFSRWAVRRRGAKAFASVVDAAPRGFFNDDEVPDGADPQPEPVPID